MVQDTYASVVRYRWSKIFFLYQDMFINNFTFSIKNDSNT